MAKKEDLEGLQGLVSIRLFADENGLAEEDIVKILKKNRSKITKMGALRFAKLENLRAAINSEIDRQTELSKNREESAKKRSEKYQLMKEKARAVDEMGLNSAEEAKQIIEAGKRALGNNNNNETRSTETTPVESQQTEGQAGPSEERRTEGPSSESK